MKTYKHLNVKTVSEASRLLKEYKGKAKMIAGGTDLLGILKDRILPDYPEAIINLKTVPGLDYIKEDSKGLKIGALTKLANIAQSPVINGNYKVLGEAALAVATPQIRNMGTIGGNLCQDVRCWYYRYPRHIGGPLRCFRKGNGPCLAVKGDNRYHAIMDGKKCFAVCPSDTAVALAALEGRITIAGPKGKRRRIGMGDFFTAMGNVLTPEEIVKEIEIPVITSPTRQTFLKSTLRKPVDFAIVSVASLITLEEGVCKDARIALGAVAPAPVRARGAEEAIIGRFLDENVAAEAAALALEGARPLSRNAYKIEIAKTFVKRAILS